MREIINLITTIVILAITMLVIIIMGSAIKEERVRTEIHGNAENITFYLDGEEIDYNTIDLDQYDISYKPEEQKVFLTREDDSEVFFMPFPVFFE